MAPESNSLAHTNSEVHDRFVTVRVAQILLDCRLGSIVQIAVETTYDGGLKISSSGVPEAAV